MPTATSTLAIPYPLGTDDADVPSDMGALANRVETLMLRSGEIATHPPVAGDAGKIVVCQSDGHLAYKVMSGKATIAADGTVSVPNNAFTGAELADNSVGGRALDDNSVADANVQAAAAIQGTKINNLGGRFKPTMGRVHASGTNLNLPGDGSWADVPGTNITITPAVASYAMIWAIFEMTALDNASVAGLYQCEANGRLMVDSTPESDYAALAHNDTTESSGITSGIYGTPGQAYLVPLSAASHAFKLQARLFQGTSGICYVNHTCWMYVLVAQ